MDFKLKVYKTIVKFLLGKKYQFLTIEKYSTYSNQINAPIVIMRHDVDRKPGNALRMAKLEAKLGIQATFYFRTISQTFKPDIIKEIAKLGHEIGYHYENLSEVGDKRIAKSDRDLYELAIKDFEYNLAKLREIVPIKNIAMHGRPTSKYDSRDLWKKYNYKDFGIISEPYFDIDFDEVLYITDAGRSWDNQEFNKRDKVTSRFNFQFKSTNDIIQALEDNKLPNKIMINIHPEHWANSNAEWLKIWVVRKLKNTVKKMII